MESEIKTFTYENGDVQRVRVVHPDSFDALEFFRPAPSEQAFPRLVALYRDFIVARAPFIFGKLVLFRIPDDFSEEALPPRESAYGTLFTPEARVKAAFLRDVHWKGHTENGAPAFRSASTEKLWNELVARGSLEVVRGSRRSMSFLPVAGTFGMLSETEPDAAMKVNASFFVMDCFDCGTIYDTIGTPLGLCVKNGEVLNPPLFDREVFSVRGGSCAVESVPLACLKAQIGGQRYEDGQEGVKFYMRPERANTRSGGYDIIVVGQNVVAVKRGGRSKVPCSGFVIHTPKDPGIRTGARVFYRGAENLDFAIQVGNSAIRGGVRTEDFISRFYDIKKIWTTAYPPSLYPLNYEKARAPRIVLGADENDRPMILWFEGAGKFGYEPGRDSCGASLSEAAAICETLGMKNGIHLDGGGSAQIITHGERVLKVSDRDPSDFSEHERAVPMGLIVR